MVQRTSVQEKGGFTLDSLLQLIRENPRLGEAGAIVCLIGIARGYTHDGRKVGKLELEAYQEEALEGGEAYWVR